MSTQEGAEEERPSQNPLRAADAQTTVDSSWPMPVMRSAAQSGRPQRASPPYIVMGSLAWRVTYQQGRLPLWGKIECVQRTSSSGWTASI
jgi:hypothetical protein